MKAFNRNIFRVLLTAGLLLAGTDVMWGASHYYAKVTVAVEPEGKGKVYVMDGDDVKQTNYTKDATNTEGGDLTFTIGVEDIKDGYHFTGWTGDGIAFRSAVSLTTNATVSASSKENDTISYTATANLAENFYATLELDKTVGTSEAPTGGGSKNTATSGDDVTFSIVAADASSGYHFTRWTGDNITFSSASSLTTNATVATATTGGSGNAKTYTAKANYAENVYYAKLTASSNGNGTASVTVTPKSTTTPGGDVVFEITATPQTGYHFAGWETSGSGSFGNAASASTTFTASASSNYDEDNAATYTVTAKFEKDTYNAKLNTAASSALEGTKGGSAQVSDGSNWSGSVTKSATTGNQDVSFSVKATPNKGYQFVGWSKNNASTSYIAGLGAEGSYSVKSADSEGSCNEETIYAVFDKGTYKIHFLANSKPESGRTVTGEMSDQTFTSGVAQKLSPLGFVCDYTVTYDAQGGQCSTPYETKSRFTRWKEYSGSETVNTYNDEAEVNRMENHGTTVNLTATWTDKLKFTLPTPTKQKDGVDKTFLGWYDAAEGGNKVGAAGAEVEISSTQTLFAHWKECNITISVTGTAEGNMVFNVTRSGTPATHYRVSVPAGGSVTLTDVVPGSYAVAPETGWSWNTQISPETKSIEFNSASTDSETLTAEFTVSSKNSTKKHVEESLVID